MGWVHKFQAGPIYNKLLYYEQNYRMTYRINTMRFIYIQGWISKLQKWKYQMAAFQQISKKWKLAKDFVEWDWSYLIIHKCSNRILLCITWHDSSKWTHRTATSCKTVYRVFWTRQLVQSTVDISRICTFWPGSSSGLLPILVRVQPEILSI